MNGQSVGRGRGWVGWAKKNFFLGDFKSGMTLGDPGTGRISEMRPKNSVQPDSSVFGKPY